MYRERINAKAIVHLNSTYSVALSCLADIDHTDVPQPITAYAVMRVGKLPLGPYFRPGDLALVEAVAKYNKPHHAILLANHGPVVTGKDLDSAVYAAEELEETAKLHLFLRVCDVRLLSADQVTGLRETFPS